ncbi:MAG: hypothetical protein EZS28_051409, partial [Streblomastix strix]
MMDKEIIMNAGISILQRREFLLLLKELPERLYKNVDALIMIRELIIQQGDNNDVVGVNVTSNEVYEEETITVPDNKAYIIQPKEEDPENPPVLRPAEKTDDQGKTLPSTKPLVNVEGNRTLEIQGLIIEHFQSQTTSPVLKTDGDAIL